MKLLILWHCFFPKRQASNTRDTRKRENSHLSYTQDLKRARAHRHLFSIWPLEPCLTCGRAGPRQKIVTTNVFVLGDKIFMLIFLFSVLHLKACALSAIVLGYVSGSLSLSPLVSFPFSRFIFSSTVGKAGLAEDDILSAFVGFMTLDRALSSCLADFQASIYRVRASEFVFTVVSC